MVVKKGDKWDRWMVVPWVVKKVEWWVGEKGRWLVVTRVVDSEICSVEWREYTTGEFGSDG